ncbi:hypothetical protein [Neptunitalea lumnitzerae]|uniref:GLPGLI family protein n=1 Tax=Neptunitalea lumnitzerae TaxID=2965509 RepID=A0ABQ5MEP3_9FLAO|nr:hypothetical protein [Neptunitalea sp. Y10]GLB47843.1 hypothetical protein Y10_02110 [Neptunitalea sp. Y10]
MHLTRLFLLLCFFTLSLTTKAQKSFEGIITHKITYNFKDNKEYSEYYQTMLSDTITFYIGKKKQMYVFNASASSPTSKNVLLIKKGLDYTYTAGNDTIFTANANENKDVLMSFKKNQKPKKTIMGLECESITMRVKGTEGGYTVTSYYNPKYYLNPKPYKNIEQSFYNQFIEEAKSITLSTIIEYESGLTVTFEAISVNPQNIADSTFELPKDKVYAEGKKQ